MNNDVINKKFNWPWADEVSPEVYKRRISWPKISIVTPSYNQGQFIEETILSILNQNYPNLEYIIIDGGSTDNTVEIIKKYEDRITYWVSEKDEGQANAINKGFAVASGEIRAYINSDDVYYPNTFLKVAEACESYLMEKKIIVGDCNWGTTIFNGILSYDSPIFPGRLSEALIRGSVCPQPSVFWTLPDRFKNTLLFDEGLDFCMDFEFWLKLMNQKYYVIRINEPLSFFRTHPDSKTTNLQLISQIEKIAIATRYSSDLTMDERTKVLQVNKNRIDRIIYAEYKQTILLKRSTVSFKKIIFTVIPLIYKVKLIVFKLKLSF